MLVFADVETTGLRPGVDRLVLVGFAARGVEPVLLEHGSDNDLIQGFLDLEDTTFCGHACNFDRHFLQAAKYRVPDRWIDTQILAHVAGIDGERKAGNTALARLTKRLIGLGELPQDVLQAEARITQWLRCARRQAAREGRTRPEKGDAPLQLLKPYLAADLHCTRAVHDHYAANVNGQRDVLKLEQRVAPAVFSAERLGAPIDMEAALRVRFESVAKLSDLRGRLFELAGGPFSLDSSQQLERVLRDRGVDLDCAPRTPTGLLARSAQALERIDDDLVSVLKEHRAERVFHGLLDGLLKRTVDGRLHASFRQCGAETGRMSSGDPNVQNVPASDLRARYCVCAPARKVLVGADLSAVELRVLAGFAPGGALARDLAAGVDPHQRVADEFAVERDVAKRFNFGVLYGAGAPRVAEILGIDRAAARAALDRWYETYPEIARLKAQLSRQIRRRGYIETIGGRRHYADRANHMTVNYLVQGSAADLFKAAIAELHAAGCPLILLVHDEVVAEVDEDEAEATAALLQEVLPQSMQRGEIRIDGLSATAAIHKRWSAFKQPEYTPWASS